MGHAGVSDLTLPPGSNLPTQYPYHCLVLTHPVQPPPLHVCPPALDLLAPMDLQMTADTSRKAASFSPSHLGLAWLQSTHPASAGPQ